MNTQNTLQYHLEHNRKRKYDIMVFPDRILIKGQFWYLYNKEFRRGKNSDYGELKEYIGMGYLKKFSYKKGVAFGIVGMIFAGFGSLISFAERAFNKGQPYLELMGIQVCFPENYHVAFYVLVTLSFILGITYLFSWKNVIEISFLSKRFCVSARGMSKEEFMNLREKLLENKEA